MIESLESSLFKSLQQMQRVAGLPVIAGASAYPSAEWSSAKIYEVLVNWSPLALANWLSIGANPAMSGAVRLEDESYVVAAGDYRLIGLDSGDGWIEIDPDGYGVHFGTDQRTVNPHTEIYSGVTNYSAPATVGSPAKNPSSMAIQGQYYANGSNHLTKLMWGLTMSPGEAGSWQSIFGNAQAGIISWFDAGENKGYVTPTNPGQSLGHESLTYQWANIYASLPTSDPSVAGQFWNNLGVVMVSNG